MKSSNIVILVGVLMGFSLVTDSGSQDVPNSDELNYGLALAEARVFMEKEDIPEPEEPEEEEDSKGSFVDLDDVIPKIEVPEEPTVSEFYWDIYNRYKNSGGQRWRSYYNTNRGRYYHTGDELLEHVADHLSVEAWELSGWNDTQLEYLHGWAHEMENGRASESGELLRSTRSTSSSYQNCPTGTCPNTSSRSFLRIFK